MPLHHEELHPVFEGVFLHLLLQPLAIGGRCRQEEEEEECPSYRSVRAITSLFQNTENFTYLPGFFLMSTTSSSTDFTIRSSLS